MGCFGADYKLTVRHDTAESWLVGVSPGGNFGERYTVRRIEPAGEGIVAAWSGPSDVQIELLGGHCEVLGVFERAEDASIHVPGVEGLAGSISEWSGLTDWHNDPDTLAIEACGGVAFR